MNGVNLLLASYDADANVKTKKIKKPYHTVWDLSTDDYQNYYVVYEDGCLQCESVDISDCECCGCFY